ncbi:uncharacterized protein LOC119554172 [Drosophila subpulchrella]|uniref:uncharacterized protein LOC119554172 n=1 Tax=Drosophila subpulchrella TaxID=1486046 RepID=UPI0018A13840|nr:uncharacterized protein LOC119554172 [Drosophila subpulchrella]
MFGTWHDKSMDVQMKDSQEKEPVRLTDLPVEVLEMVMSHLGFYHHKLLRMVSEDMKHINNSYIMHRHKSYEFAHRERPTESDREYGVRMMLQVIRYSTCYFADKDYESVLAISLLFFHDSVCETVEHLSQFLVQFLFRLEDRVFQNPLQVRRLQYTLSLFSLLRQFRNFRILRFGFNPLYWILEVELNNTFIGTINRNELSGGAHKRTYFMVIIAELLFHEKKNQNFGAQKEADGTLYSYSILPNSRAKRNSRLQLKFVVQGPQSLFDYLQDVITGKDDPSKPFNMPPDSVFSAHITIKGLRGPQFVYNGDMNISILKLSELEGWSDSDSL